MPVVLVRNSFQIDREQTAKVQNDFNGWDPRDKYLFHQATCMNVHGQEQLNVIERVSALIKGR